MVTQHEYDCWRQKNYGPDTEHKAMLKLGEEYGELCHAMYRGNIVATADALADLYITLLRVAQSQGLDLAACVADAWADVKTRDYVQYPETGKPRRAL